MPGFWKLVLVATVALILYGRSGVHRHPVVRAMLPRPRPKRPPTPAPERSRLGTRAYIVLVVTAATAVAALIFSRALILSAGPPHP